MEFIINNCKWNIKEISNEEMERNYGEDGYYTHGYTCYNQDIIYINKTSPEKERTLKHELTHCWLYMYGHNQDDKHFSNEDVCEIVASINDFINQILEEYKKKG
jgi:Zn-dependent peptidase ImmA (M78 family)